MNKKGFTLVELLAVIVILAVIMLVAVTAIGPVIERANKGAFSSSVQMILAGAEAAYAADMLKASPAISRTGKTCVTVAALKDAGYFDPKGKNYTGSVLIDVNASTGKATYTIWVKDDNNSTYFIVGKTVSQIGTDAIGNGTYDATKNVKCGASYTAVTAL